MDAKDLMAVVLAGVGATALVDGWALARRRAFGTPLPNYGFVGRWIAGVMRGRLTHLSIAAAAPVRAERAIGWSTHYLIGIAFALLLPAFFGPEWIQRPTLVPALIVGIGTVAAPFLIMQPAMGSGFAASRTSRPASARAQSLITHAMYGLGLYMAGKVVSSLSTGG